MSSNINDIIDNFKEFFTQRNINFIIGGGYAIRLLCDKHKLKYDIDVNNLDIFYLANTPITPQYINNYKRVQDCPHASMTYITEEGFRINLTMLRINSILCIKENNINIMHPTKLLSFYEDELFLTDIHLIKKTYINELIDICQYHPDHKIYRVYTYQDENDNYCVDGEPLARRLFVS